LKLELNRNQKKDWLSNILTVHWFQNADQFLKSSCSDLRAYLQATLMLIEKKVQKLPEYFSVDSDFATNLVSYVLPV